MDCTFFTFRAFHRFLNQVERDEAEVLAEMKDDVVDEYTNYTAEMLKDKLKVREREAFCQGGCPRAGGDGGWGI